MVKNSIALSLLVFVMHYVEAVIIAVVAVGHGIAYVNLINFLSGLLK